MNPYDSPSTDASRPLLRFKARRKVGTGVLVIGLVALAYGAIAFWVIPVLPPNEPMTGRFNSLYVLGAGMIISLMGLAIRETRVRLIAASDTTGNGISTRVGLLILFVAAIILVVAFSILN